MLDLFALEAEWLVPLGAYPEVVMPWGLLDASGGITEWTEEVYFLNRRSDRGTDGAWAGADVAGLKDAVYSQAASLPSRSRASFVGLRVASSVPVPSVWLFGCIALSSTIVVRIRRSSQ